MRARRRPGPLRLVSGGAARPQGTGSPAGAGPAAGAAPSGGGRAAAWMELLRVSALFTVPGDALAGAAAAGRRPDRGTALAVGASLCLYEAGMALNDWADREEDAVERPGRPLPSGRIGPGAALAAAGALTGTGLALAAAAGRPALATATALAGTVWAYDLGLKHTAAGPAAMSAARALDLLLGAHATGRSGHSRVPPASRAGWSEAALLGAHTLAVTTVSRRETYGASAAVPLGALAAVAAVAAATAHGRSGSAPPGTPGVRSGPGGPGVPGGPGAAGRAPVPSLAAVLRTGPLTAALATAYAAAAARPLLHAALNPSPPLLQRAVGGGIRAMIPLQAALAARAGSPGTAVTLLGLLPVARRLSRKVSPT